MIRDIQVSFSGLKYYGNESSEDVKIANGTTHKDVDLFLRLLSETKVKVGGKIVKINIDFTENERQLYSPPPDNININGVVSVFKKLPFENLKEYLELSEIQKSEFIIKYILKGFEEISNRTDTIDMNLINSIAEECRRLNYKNHYYFGGKLKSSKDRKHKAGMWIEHEMDIFKLYLDILDKNEKLLKRELVAETDSGYPKYYPLLGGFKWIDNNTVELFNRKREVLKIVSLDEI